MAAKQYEVLRQFRRVDPSSGETVDYEVGGTYSGPVEEYHTSHLGPDGMGALLRDKTAAKKADEALPSIFDPASDSSKGK